LSTVLPRKGWKTGTGARHILPADDDGFFEGIDNERGIAWRVADSLTMRHFPGIGLDERTPDL
jgi:hypothetical protein